MRGPQAPFPRVEHEPPVDALDDEYPLRLTTGRRLESYNTGVQTGAFRSPLHRGETLDLSPRGRRGARRRRRRARAGHLAPRLRRGAGAASTEAAPRPGFMTFHFPDQVDTNLLTIDATDPEIGHRRVQGRRRANRQAEAPARGRAAPAASPGECGPLARSTPPTAEERAAVDACSARPRAGPAPRGERPLLHGGASRAGDGTCSSPRCMPCRRASGWVSPGALGYVVRAARRAAGRGLRRRHVLRACSRSHRGRRSWPTSATTSPARPPARTILCARLEHRLGPAGEGRERTWMRSPCLGLCEKAPAALLIAAGAQPFERALGHADIDSVGWRRSSSATSPAPSPPCSPRPGAASSDCSAG